MASALRDRPSGRQADGVRRESFRWPDETVTRSFTILTTAPIADMAGLHDRKPVILEEQDRPTWLGEIEGDHAALLHPAPEELLGCAQLIGVLDRRATMDQVA